MPSIYILLCEGNRYYIGKTERQIECRIEEHFRNCGSEWTKKYKPIEVVEIRKDADDFDEDKFTKVYMKKYGIDNVRGGAYTQLHLSDYQRKTLEMELCSVSDLCFRCNRFGHFANKCYAKTNSDGALLDVKKENNMSSNQMRDFINQKFTETKRQCYNLTTYHDIFAEMCKNWRDDYLVQKPLYPDFLAGCTAVWNNNLQSVLITKNGIDYCFPKPYKNLDGGIVRRHENLDMMEIKSSNAQAFLQYVVPLNGCRQTNDINDVSNLVNEGISKLSDLASTFFNTVTLRKVVRDNNNTKLEMDALSITRIRELNKSRIQLGDHVYNIINTKRDLGLFAGSKANYIIVEGNHDIIPSTYKLIMHSEVNLI